MRAGRRWPAALLASWLLIGLLAASLAGAGGLPARAWAAPAAATILFSDTFDRADSSTVGNAWTEIETTGADVGIQTNRLCFLDTSDLANRPLVRHSFQPAAAGQLTWQFDFDWTRTGSEGVYRHFMQLGQSSLLSDSSQNSGVGINLLWTAIGGVHQTLAYRRAGVDTALVTLSGAATLSVVADLDTHTYQVLVNGSVVGSGLPFDNNVALDTVRYFTDGLNEANFSGRCFDNLSISVPEGAPTATPTNTPTPTIPGQPTATNTPTLTSTPTATATGTPTATPTLPAGGLFSDTFDRPDSGSVGNGWAEVEAAGADAGIQANRLCFLDASEVTNRPMVRHTFPQAASGSLTWEFDFDWTRIQFESAYVLFMQLGQGSLMSDSSQDAGVGVSLVWRGKGTVQQQLAYRKDGAATGLRTLSGPAHLLIEANLDTDTYSVSVDGVLAGSGIPFEDPANLDTVRFFTNGLNEVNFSGRCFDNLVVSGVSGPPTATATFTATSTGQPTATFTPTATATSTPTPSATASPTPPPGGGPSFSDFFDRTAGSTVGNGWLEVETTGADAGIQSNRLCFLDTSDLANRPQVSHTFSQAAAGSLIWEFDFDWARARPEGNYAVYMQLGQGNLMGPDAQDTGTGVNLVWTVVAGTHQTLAYRRDGTTTALRTLSGPAHLVIRADLDTDTYTVLVDGVQAGGALPFEDAVNLDTVRFFTSGLTEQYFSGRCFDTLSIQPGGGAMTPPAITSSPVTQGSLWAAYSYDVNATGQPAPTFFLKAAPPGMSIDAGSGLISWTPPAVGVYSVTVQANNAAGSAAQSFTVTATTSAQFTCAAPVRIMPLGDSITRGSSSGVTDETAQISYRKDLWDGLQAAGRSVDFVGSLTNGQFYAGFDANHEGHAGWRDDQIALNIYNNGGANWLTGTPADVILLHIGTNALSPSPTDVENILNEIDQYEADHNTTVIVVLARIINMVPNNITVTAFNDNVQAMALARIRSGDKIYLVNMETGAGLVYSLQPAGDMWDSLHPYATGYTKMAAVWQPALNALLPACP